MNLCTAPYQNQTTGELVCPLGAYPEDGDWQRVCELCQAAREHYDELIRDMRYEDG